MTSLRHGGLCGWMKSATSSSRSFANIGTGKRIGVIGGGLAGVVAANKLSARGCNVTVFEAEQELGGRLGTITLPLPVSAQTKANGISVDSACVFIKASRGTDFRQHLDQCVSTGAVGEWNTGMPHAIEGPGKFVPLEGSGPSAEAPWFVAKPNMSSLVDTLLPSVKRRTRCHVNKICRIRDGSGSSSSSNISSWCVNENHDERFDTLIIAMPISPALQLYRSSTSDHAGARPGLVDYLTTAVGADVIEADFEKSRFSLALAFDRPLDVPFSVAFPAGSPITLVYDVFSRPGKYGNSAGVDADTGGVHG